MDFKVGLTDEALADLRGIAEFIAQSSPDAAARVGNELLDIADSLSVLPNRGVPVSRRRDMRKVFRWNYVIYYRVIERTKQVEVLRIWDARQAPWKLRLLGESAP